MSALVDVRPPAIDVLFRPGTTFTLTANWLPVNVLDNRSFTATLDGVALTTAVTVVDEEMTIVVTDTETALLDGPVEFQLLEEIDGTDEPIIVGNWRASDRAQVASSQTVTVVQGAATAEVTVTNGQASIDIEDLPTASVPLTGSELIPGLQNDVAVAFTTQDLVGGPMETYQGVDRLRLRGFDDLQNFVTNVTTNGTHIGATTLKAALSGTSSLVSQGANIGEYGVADLHTGTTSSGRAGLELPYPAFHLFEVAKTVDMGARVRLPTTVSDGTNTYRVLIGVGILQSAAPPDGFFFRSPAAAGNWEAVIRRASTDLATFDTGIATDHGGTNFHTFRVRYDPTFGVRFWINGVLEAQETVNIPQTLDNITFPAVSIVKTAGATNRIVEVDAMSWNVELASRSLRDLP